MKIIKRIVLFISLFVLYIIFREFLELYTYSRGVHPVLGYAVLGMIFSFSLYFVGIPIYRIFTLPRNPGPVQSMEDEPDLIAARVEGFEKNPYLLGIDHTRPPDLSDREYYERTIRILEKECNLIRKRYVARLFYASSVSQNGFIDAVLVLSSAVNLVKEIFILYNGRVSNRDLWTIAKKIYLSIAIAGSEGIEYVTEEIIAKLGSQTVKGIPFIDKILGSIADGFVNALLLNRISFISENYCKLTYLPREQRLSPSPVEIFKATKQITSDMTDKLILVIRRISIDKTINTALVALNPVGFVWERTFDRLIADESVDNRGLFKNLVIETGKFAGNPITYGFGKLYNLFGRDRTMSHDNFNNPVR